MGLWALFHHWKWGPGFPSAPPVEAGPGGDPKMGTAPKIKGVWDPQRGVIRHNELIKH